MFKKILTLAALTLAFYAGTLAPKHFITRAHAQVPSTSYPCDFGNSGTTSASPCTQYLVAVSPQRLGGGFMIWQVEDTPFAVNGATNLYAVGSGSINGGASIQAFLPGSTTSTFTLAATRP